MDNNIWSLFGHLQRRNTNNTNNTPNIFTDFLATVNEQYETERLLRETLNTPSSYKFVLDPSATNIILKIPYTETDENEKVCPISLEEFDNGEIVSKLPCNHIFKTDAIDNWLLTQKAECPVCRFKMPCIEVRNTDEQETTNEIVRASNIQRQNDNDESNTYNQGFPALINTQPTFSTYREWNQHFNNGQTPPQSNTYNIDSINESNENEENIDENENLSDYIQHDEQVVFDNIINLLNNLYYLNNMSGYNPE
jgi:hypothetical protein